MTYRTLELVMTELKVGASKLDTFSTNEVAVYQISRENNNRISLDRITCDEAYLGAVLDFDGGIVVIQDVGTDARPTGPPILDLHVIALLNLTRE
jgi:hypothetical protein